MIFFAWFWIDYTGKIWNTASQVYRLDVMEATKQSPFTGSGLVMALVAYGSATAVFVFEPIIGYLCYFIVFGWSIFKMMNPAKFWQCRQCMYRVEK